MVLVGFETISYSTEQRICAKMIITKKKKRGRTSHGGCGVLVGDVLLGTLGVCIEFERNDKSLRFNKTTMPNGASVNDIFFHVIIMQSYIRRENVRSLEQLFSE